MSAPPTPSHPITVSPPHRLTVSLLRVLISAPFIVLVRLYQITLSPLMGGHCRFHPTCSHYALDALREHPPHRALWLIARRIARCHPWGGGGYDPVPLNQRRVSGNP